MSSRTELQDVGPALADGLQGGEVIAGETDPAASGSSTLSQLIQPLAGVIEVGLVQVAHHEGDVGSAGNGWDEISLGTVEVAGDIQGDGQGGLLKSEGLVDIGDVCHSLHQLGKLEEEKREREREGWSSCCFIASSGFKQLHCNITYRHVVEHFQACGHVAEQHVVNAAGCSLTTQPGDDGGRGLLRRGERDCRCREDQRGYDYQGGNDCVLAGRHCVFFFPGKTDGEGLCRRK